MPTLDDVAADLARECPYLYVRALRTDVINFRRRNLDLRLTQEDVTLVRARLAEAGFTEAESWTAAEGMSWLSDGIQSVSIRTAQVVK